MENESHRYESFRLLYKPMKQKSEEKEFVSAPAILYKGNVYAILPPAKHQHILWDICDRYGVDRLTDEYDVGFLTNQARFVNRIEAAKIARDSGQIRVSKIYTPRLLCEDLWP